MGVPAILALLFLAALALWLRTTLLPDRVATVVEVVRPMARCDASCAREAVRGSTVTVRVDSGDGRLEEAECSGCSVCMGDIREGHVVGLSRIGSRLIAQPLLLPSLQRRWAR
jgi:hypothetical protein